MKTRWFWQLQKDYFPCSTRLGTTCKPMFFFLGFGINIEIFASFRNIPNTIFIIHPRSAERDLDDTIDSFDDDHVPEGVDVVSLHPLIARDLDGDVHQVIQLLLQAHLHNQSSRFGIVNTVQYDEIRINPA